MIHICRISTHWILAVEVGGSVFLLAAGALATRYKKVEPDLLAIQDSFRILGRR